MARKTLTLSMMLATAALLSGCGGVKKELGLGRSNPDEFAVVSQAPLSLPPDYELRPPQPGAARPQDVTPAGQAEQSLFNGTDNSPSSGKGDYFPGVTPAPRTGVSQSTLSEGGEDALLGMAGANKAPADIRRLVNRESTATAEEEKSLRDSIVFWRDPPPAGTVVDANEEQKRLKDNQALNKPLNNGATPTIDRKGKGTLGGLF